MNAPAQSSLFDRHSASATETKPAQAVTSSPAPTQPMLGKRTPFSGTHDKHEMHQNSIATYREEATAGHLSKRCSEIMEILERIGQGTDRQILAASKYREMNSIQPRISELVKCGQLEEFDNIQDETTGKTVRVVRIAYRAPAGRQEQLAAAAGSVSVLKSAPGPKLAAESSVCARCRGAGRRRVPGSEPPVFVWCDETTNQACIHAERRRSANPDPNHELSPSEMEAMAR